MLQKCDKCNEMLRNVSFCNYELSMKNEMFVIGMSRNVTKM